MRFLVLGLILLTGCTASDTIEGQPTPAAGGAGGASGAGGGTVSSSTSGTGGDGFGGFPGTGGAGGMVVWEDDCTNTGVSIQVDAGAVITLNESCSLYAKQHHAGPVAYETLGGFYGTPWVEACNSGSGHELHMSIRDDTGDPDSVLGGYFSDGNAFWDITGGTLTQTGGSGEIGEVIAGSYTLTLEGNMSATGTLRVCRIPDLPLP
jgi:hypothetical protein